MSNEQERINQWFRKHGWNNKTFFNRPHWTRRDFFSVIGAGVTGSFSAAAVRARRRCFHGRSHHQEHRART